jgi:two-component system sensor histidine kinase/response regulator
VPTLFIAGIGRLVSFGLAGAGTLLMLGTCIFTSLLVEDNHINQLIVIAFLSTVGATIVSTDNGQLASDELIKQDFDMVLMDIQMPVMDGCTAIEKIKKQTKFTTLPVIAYSATIRQLSVDSPTKSP